MERFKVSSREVAKRWKEQYYVNGAWKSTIMPKSSQNIYIELLELDPDTATVADIEAVLGNKSWTTAYCGDCMESDSNAVILRNGKALCAECVKKAYKILVGWG